MKPTWGLVALVLIGTCFAVEPTEDQKKAISAISAIEIANAQRALERAEKALGRAKSMPIPAGAGKKSKVEREAAKTQKLEAIAAAESAVNIARVRLDDALDGKAFKPSYLFVPASSTTYETPKLDAIGTLSNAPLKVFQVLDAEKMLIKIGGPIGLSGFERTPEAIALLRMPTEGLVDDAPLRFGDRVFSVVGTYRYTTAYGAQRTVVALEELNIKPILDALRQKP